MPTEYMLTTLDNPFDPFTQFREWYEFDVAQGYHTSAYLARIAFVSAELSEADQIEIMNKAIDEIIEINALGIYRKVESKSVGSS